MDTVKYRLRRLIEYLTISSICFTDKPEIGYTIKRLSPEDRELLKQAKPEDFNHMVR